MKIFYNPETLKIMGMSDEISMEYPYVETKKKYHSLKYLKIVKRGKGYKVEPTEGTLTPEIVEEVMPRKGRYISRLKDIESKINSVQINNLSTKKTK